MSGRASISSLRCFPWCKLPFRNPMLIRPGRLALSDCCPLAVRIGRCGCQGLENQIHLLRSQLDQITDMMRCSAPSPTRPNPTRAAQRICSGCWRTCSKKSIHFMTLCRDSKKFIDDRSLPISSTWQANSARGNRCLSTGQCCCEGQFGGRGHGTLENCHCEPVEEDDILTVMMRNIPNKSKPESVSLQPGACNVTATWCGRYTQKMLIDEVNEVGFNGTWDTRLQRGFRACFVPDGVSYSGLRTSCICPLLRAYPKSGADLGISGLESLLRTGSPVPTRAMLSSTSSAQNSGPAFHCGRLRVMLCRCRGPDYAYAFKPDPQSGRLGRLLIKAHVDATCKHAACCAVTCMCVSVCAWHLQRFR